jgi:hypothetical protein
MNDLKGVITANYIKIVESVVKEEIDLLLLYLAIVVMKVSGHRYGSFLEATSTAAKLAVYITYLEQGRNQRKTGFLHHIETRRVKQIVEEMEAVITEGKGLKMLGKREPQYLIGIPYLWKDNYPVQNGERFTFQGFSEIERQYLASLLPPDAPDACIITDAELTDLIHQIHCQCQEELEISERRELSDFLIDHIRFCLLHSGTAKQIKLPDYSICFYALLKQSYTPKSHASRVQAMFFDTLRFFKIMHQWTCNDPDVFRAIEVFTIDPDSYNDAVGELDEFLTNWADKYHSENKRPVVLQLVLGDQTDDLNT